MKPNLLTLFLLGATPLVAEKSYDTIGLLESHDPRFDELVVPGTKIEIIAKDFTWIEGPLWLSSENHLVFSNIPANKLWKWTPGKGAVTYLEKSGYLDSKPRVDSKAESDQPGSNGLVLSPEGKLVLCQHGLRQVGIMTSPLNAPKPQYKALTDRNHEGRRYNSPNDGCFHKDGSFFFTDPPYGLPGKEKDPGRETPYCGVYRVSKDGKVTLIDDQLERPNGIALSPDQNTLYVANSHKPRAIWMSYQLNPDGTVRSKKAFKDVTKLVGTRKGMPDGLEVHPNGTLFATGPGGVWVMAPDGKHLGTIVTREFASNVAFGPDAKTLYITADMLLLRVKLK